MYYSEVNCFCSAHVQNSRNRRHIRVFTLSSSSVVGICFRDLSSVWDFGYIGMKFKAVFFHTPCIVATCWHLIWLCMLQHTCEWMEQTCIWLLFRLFRTCVEQKPLTLEQYRFGKGWFTQRELSNEPSRTSLICLPYGRGHQVPEAQGTKT